MVEDDSERSEETLPPNKTPFLTQAAIFVTSFVTRISWIALFLSAPWAIGYIVGLYVTSGNRSDALATVILAIPVIIAVFFVAVFVLINLILILDSLDTSGRPSTREIAFLASWSRPNLAHNWSIIWRWVIILFLQLIAAASPLLASLLIANLIAPFDPELFRMSLLIALAILAVLFTCYKLLLSKRRK